MLSEQQGTRNTDLLTTACQILSADLSEVFNLIDSAMLSLSI